MSAEAMGWVFRYSPFKGATYAVHLAMADSANDQNDYLVWLSNPKTAAKARCEVRSVVAAKARLVEDGFAQLVDTQHGNAGSATYRMLFPDVPVVYDSTEGRSTHANRAPVQSATSANDCSDPCNPLHPLAQSTESSPITNPSELNEPNGRRRRRATQVPDDFSVTHEMRRWCASQNITSDPLAETEKFIDHFTAKGDTKLDWVAAWRNWMRNADKWSSERASKQQSTRSRSLQAIERAMWTDHYGNRVGGSMEETPESMFALGQGGAR